MKKLEQEIFSDKSKIFKWPPFFYIHRYTPNFFIKRLQIVYIFFFYMSPDWEGLRRGWIHPFFNKNVIFDENLWFFKNFFSLKMIKKQFPIHPSFQNKCLKSNSKIFKSHQIQPNYDHGNTSKNFDAIKALSDWLESDIACLDWLRAPSTNHWFKNLP